MELEKGSSPYGRLKLTGPNKGRKYDPGINDNSPIFLSLLKKMFLFSEKHLCHMRYKWMFWNKEKNLMSSEISGYTISLFEIYNVY